ncbi:MAG: helix-turn-helix transcriptional regulator [Pseudomonadota bacterium]
MYTKTKLWSRDNIGATDSFPVYNGWMVEDDDEKADAIERGIRIREAREAAGLTQQQIADACEVTRGAVSGWEKGRNSPTGQRLIVLSRMIGRPREWIMFGKDPRLSEQGNAELEAAEIAADYVRRYEEEQKRTLDDEEWHAVFSVYYKRQLERRSKPAKDEI